jgi:hypothetical protein
VGPDGAGLHVRTNGHGTYVKPTTSFLLQPLTDSLLDLFVSLDLLLAPPPPPPTPAAGPGPHRPDPNHPGPQQHSTPAGGHHHQPPPPPARHSPHELTVQRSHGVRNDRLARTAVTVGLHDHVRLCGPVLRARVRRFVEGQQQQQQQPGAGGGPLAFGAGRAAASQTALPAAPGWSEESRAVWAAEWRVGGGGRGGEGGDEDEFFSAEEGEEDAGGEGQAGREQKLPAAPKVLADVVEALIAAVWVDSGGDMGVVAEVARRVVQAGRG